MTFKWLCRNILLLCLWYFNDYYVILVEHIVTVIYGFVVTLLGAYCILLVIIIVYCIVVLCDIVGALLSSVMLF